MTTLYRSLREKVFGFTFAGDGLSSPVPAVVTMAQKIYTAGNVAPLSKARFHATIDQVPVDGNGNMMLNEADRAVIFAWVRGGDFNGPDNSRNASRKRVCRFTMTNTCVRGSGNEGHVVPFTSNEASDDGRKNCVQFAGDRVLSDAEDLATVLGFDQLVQGAEDDEPRINDIHREGDSVVIPSPSVLLCETTYVMTYRWNSLASHAP